MADIHIDHNLQKIWKRIQVACEKSGRDPGEITLVAVTKTKPVEYITEAVKCGHFAFGENRMKELEEKMEAVDNPEIDWHMIGNLQTNKIKFIAGRVNWIQSVEKPKYLKEINKRAAEHKRIVNVLIQVNISGESQKGGCKPEQLKEVLMSATGLDHVQVKGLMGMATFADNPEEVRPEFRLLKKLFEEHKILKTVNIDLQELSMGMSNDMEVAIEEGSTMVRIGSDIFGPRNYQ